MNNQNNGATTGFLFAAGSFVIWGALPLYWSLLFEFSPLTILCYRIVWSWVLVAALLAAGKKWRFLPALWSDKRTLLLTALSGLIINLNWGIYIYAISSGRVVEASMGYYINPLVSALAGALFFGERMRRLQKAAIALALAGVSYMIFAYGEVPVFALSLAFTFAAYGALRKFVKIGVLEGMFCEMCVSILPAVLYLWLYSAGTPYFRLSPGMMLLVAASGPLTALPLMGFAAGVKRLSLTTVGVIQYLSPSMTFLVGVFYFKEAVNSGLLLVFGFIWAGVLVYLFDGLAWHRLHVKRVRLS